MSLGIEYDAKFAMLINRLLIERRKFDMAYQTHDNLSYLSQKDMSDKLLSIAHNMDERAETTLKHIYKYINKHVEREIEKAREAESRNPVEIFNELRKSHVFRIPAKNIFDTLDLFPPIRLAIKEELFRQNPLLNWVYFSVNGDRESFDKSCVVLRVFVNGTYHSVRVHLRKEDGLFNIDVETIAKVLLFRLYSKLSTVHRHASK